jgi:hypothetical protein
MLSVTPLYSVEWQNDTGMKNWKESGRNGTSPDRDSVAYLLKARTVEVEKQPLLGNARTQQYRNCLDTRCDAYRRSYGTVE